MPNFGQLKAGAKGSSKQMPNSRCIENGGPLLMGNGQIHASEAEKGANMHVMPDSWLQKIWQINVRANSRFSISACGAGGQAGIDAILSARKVAEGLPHFTLPAKKRTIHAEAG